jgi:hypothetical protein
MLGLEDRGGWNDWGGADNEPSLDDVAHEVMAGRERETSSQDSATGTERARRNGTADPDETLHASHRGEREDVWVPSLTPDGRVSTQIYIGAQSLHWLTITAILPQHINWRGVVVNSWW